MRIINHGAAQTRLRNDEQAREPNHASSDMNSAVQQCPICPSDQILCNGKCDTLWQEVWPFWQTGCPSKVVEALSAPILYSGVISFLDVGTFPTKMNQMAATRVVHGLLGVGHDSYNKLDWKDKITRNYIKFLIFIPIPIKNIQKPVKMSKTRLENGRGIIPDTSGRPLYSGNLDGGQCWAFLFLFREKLELKKLTF